ncbi:hypothetical protein WAF17_16560 [Bernardetia sp. ABR2-2B]|uniref:hypothetical protein n=1 Tax=Bernardetia sp. ABR2-2B TaxID=3127472 RepID=UPI0030CF9B7F
MKNYTTKIAVSKTSGEIIELLTENDAKNITIQNYEKKPVGIIFSLDIKDKEVRFLLEANVDATLRAMVVNKKVTKSHKNIEQAERTAWRNLKLYLEVKLAFIAVEGEKEQRMLEMQKEFFANMIDMEQKTLFQAYKEDEKLRLTQ